jgi:hypothetical protein
MDMPLFSDTELGAILCWRSSAIAAAWFAASISPLREAPELSFPDHLNTGICSPLYIHLQ